MMKAEAVMHEIDLLGADGGRLALAFAAGSAACFTFLRTIFTSPLRQRIKELESSLDADRERCSAMEVRLVQRINQLEGFILAMSPGNLRQDFQKALSEQRIAEDEVHRGQK